MNITGIAAKAVKIGMNLAGDARETVTLRLGYSPGSYDPLTDSKTPDAGQAVTVQVLPYKRKQSQGATLQVNTNQVTDTTETLLVQSADLPQGATITEEDTVLRAGAEWAIVDVSPIPGAYLLDVRK